MSLGLGQPGIVQTVPGNLQPIITALQALTKKQQSPKVAVQAVAFSLNIKLINPDKKSVFETYVLREVGSFNAATPIQLRQQILKQFGDKLVQYS